jgi:hypothetical protein
MKQEPEDLRARVIGFVGIGFVVLTVALAGISWWLVQPTPAYVTLPPSTLEHDLFELRQPAPPGTAVEWVDRGAGTARIPIESAIDAVVADPSLIGGKR